MSIRRVPLECMTSEFRKQVEASKNLGQETRFLEIAANAPHMVEFYWGAFYEGVFWKGEVPIRIKELVRLRLAQLHGCVF